MSAHSRLPIRRPLHVAIVGVGGTGSEIAHVLVRRGLVHLSLIDLDEDRAIGKSLDLQQSGALYGKDVSVQAGKDWSLMAMADVVVITAGRGRRPGEPREHMMMDNGALVHAVAKAAADLAPDAFLIVLTNPADLLTHIAYKASGFPLGRVMGQGGILDSARLAFLVAQEAGVSVQSVHAMVLGGHGDNMVPLLDCVSVHGVPAKHLLSSSQWTKIVERTRRGGEEILTRFKTQGASITPGLAVYEMIDALTQPLPRILPISTMPQGQYGLQDVFLGVPALISSQGVERVLELPLGPAELAMLHMSADTQRTAYSAWMNRQDQPF